MHDVERVSVAYGTDPDGNSLIEAPMSLGPGPEGMERTAILLNPG